MLILVFSVIALLAAVPVGFLFMVLVGATERPRATAFMDDARVGRHQWLAEALLFGPLLGMTLVIQYAPQQTQTVMWALLDPGLAVWLVLALFGVLGFTLTLLLLPMLRAGNPRGWWQADAPSRKEKPPQTVLRDEDNCLAQLSLMRRPARARCVCAPTASVPCSAGGVARKPVQVPLRTQAPRPGGYVQGAHPATAEWRPDTPDFPRRLFR